jgi:hypothetical protein
MDFDMLAASPSMFPSLSHPAVTADVPAKMGRFR